MKKYIFVFFVFSLFITLLSFGTNSASASNCASGELFNSTTGQACVTTNVSACNIGDLFSSVTGQRCPTGDGYAGISGGATVVGTFNNLLSGYQSNGGITATKALQQFLKDQGYYSGKIDGKYGAISARAVSDFQSDNNIGIINPTSCVPAGGTRSAGNNCCTGLSLQPTSYSGTVGVCVAGTQPAAISINSGSSSSSLQVGETGTWQVLINSTYTRARTSSYAIWGDEQVPPSLSSFVYVGPNDASGADDAFRFLHTYNSPGVYHPLFFVISEYGTTDRTTTTVNVRNQTTSSITVLSPNGGETYRLGVDPFSVSWTGTNLPSNDGIQFALVNSNGTVTTANAMGTGLDLKASGGSAGLNPGSIQSGSYRLKITDNNGVTDMSDGFFTITLN